MNGFWKYIALCAISCLCGVVVGSYNPNRNLVTSEDIAPIKAQLELQSNQIQGLTAEVSDLRGQLRAEKLLSQ